MEAIRNLINGVNDVSNVIELPTRLITILGIVTTALGYFTGRRRSLFEQSARGADEAMRAEMRQGFAAVSAAIAALSAGRDIAREQSAAAVTPPPAPAPGVPLDPQPWPARPPATAPSFASPVASPVAPPVVPSFATPPSPATAPLVSRGTRRWARRPVLAICAAVALALTLVGVIGIFIASVDDAVFGVFSLLALLGLMMALVTLVWACVAALRQRRWGWAAALCFGTLALTFISVFTLPTLLILIFAVWGPTPSLAKPARPRGEERGDYGTTEAGSSGVPGVVGSPHAGCRAGNQLSQAGAHQLACPSRTMSEGTIRPRTSVASIRTAIEAPMPAALKTSRSLRAEALKTATMIRAANVTSRPHLCCPNATAARLSPMRQYSSWIRVRRNTS